MSDRLIPVPKVLPPWVDKFLTYPVIFSIIVIFQGCFGGLGIIQIPKRLENMIDSPIARFIFLWGIAFTATTDSETAFFSVIAFLLLLHLLRTKEEKKKVKYFV